MKKDLLKVFLLSTLVLKTFHADSQIINTIAGSGSGVYSGDGGPATAASLYIPTSVACDAVGNIYIADKDNNVVRKVNTSGIISTVAGTNTLGYTGDGGPATNAELNNPSNVTLDRYGNLFISDEFNHVIRKVDGLGMISTFAGDGSTLISGDGGPATAAGIGAIYHTAFDTSGNLYIADQVGSIRKVSTSGIISTFAGNGTTGFSGDGGPATAAQLYWPSSVAFDTSGNLYISDRENNVIRKVNTAGIISTIAGNTISGNTGNGGPATAAELDKPDQVVIDRLGDIYFSEAYSNVIRKINPAGIISTFAGTGYPGYSGDGYPAVMADMNNPVGLTFDNVGNLILADAENSVVRKISLTDFIYGASFVCEGGTTSLGDTAAGGTWSSSNSGVAVIGSSSGTVTGVASGSAYITYTDGSTRAVAYFIVIASPPAITGQPDGCVGSAITLSDSTGGGSWTSSNVAVGTIDATTGVVTGISPGTVLITYSLGGTCETTQMEVIGVKPSPVYGDLIACIDMLPAILHDSTSGGTWSSSNSLIATVGSTGIVTGVTTGIDTITYSINGCSVSYKVYSEICEGVPGVSGAGNDLAIYPNPTYDEITINTDGTSYNTLSVFSETGQKLLLQPVNTTQTVVNIQSFPPGVYFIVLNGDSGNARRKFVKL